MIDKTTNNKDILDYVVGGMAIKDMTSLTFLQWVAGKLNGVKTYQASNQELIAFIKNPPMGRLMPEEEKCRIVRQLLDLEVNI